MFFHIPNRKYISSLIIISLIALLSLLDQIFSPIGTTAAAFCEPLSHISRASINSSGDEADNLSEHPSFSSDGRYIAFESGATNLVANSGNKRNIYVYDRETCEVDLVSGSVSNGAASAGSQDPSISSDGRYVAFTSEASNLVTGVDSGFNDIYLRDRQLNMTTRISVSNTDIQPNASSVQPRISADGSTVVFASDASNLIDNDINGTRDIFSYDVQTSILTRITKGFDGSNTSRPVYWPVFPMVLMVLIRMDGLNSQTSPLMDTTSFSFRSLTTLCQMTATVAAMYFFTIAKMQRCDCFQ
jgi:Tol biopolymer transport system component